MKSYSFSDMNRLSGEILETALSEPVALTKYGKERLVIVQAERYRSLAGLPRQMAFTVEGAPNAVNAELMDGLAAILGDELPNA